jgi:hypothetical protein
MEIGLPKFAEVLSYLDKLEAGKRAFETGMSRDLNITYSHISKLVGFFEEYGWVVIDKQGRVAYIDLTPSGKNVASLCTKLFFEISQAKPRQVKVEVKL